VIYPNRRNTKKPIAIARMFRWFDRETYRERYKVERTFGWQDTYRRLVVSYDRLKETRTGFRPLAYAMMNYRVTFSNSGRYSL
jgi:transposase